MKRTWIVSIVSAVAAMLLFGCVPTTTVKTNWKDPAYRGAVSHSMLVICSPIREEEGWCDAEFAAQLKEEGITATQGHTVSASADSLAKAFATAQKLGINTVLVSCFEGVKSQLDLYPGESPNRVLSPTSQHWSDRQYQRNDYQLFRTVLYDAATGKVIWMATSATLLYSSGRRTMESYARAVIKEMRRQKLLPSR